MKIGKNPFYYGGVVRDMHFCNRKKEINELVADIEAGLNVMLYAPRRFGKTSLVMKALEKISYPVVFMDLMGIVNAEEFINAYFNALSRSMNTPADKAVAFFRKALGLRPNITVDFDSGGKPSFSLNFLQRESKNVLEEVVNLPFRFAEHRKKKLVVVFDEFQEVVNLGIEEKLRSVLQHHGDLVSYLFLGSKKSVMKDLFFEKNKPLYKSVKHVPIGAINGRDWREYISAGFTANQKSIDTDSIDAILKVSKGFPYYTQQIAYELFNASEGDVRKEMVEKAVDSILEKEEDLFLTEWEHLSQNQKKAVKLVQYAEGVNVYTSETMALFHFTSSSLKKAIEGLIAKDVIDLKGSTWYFQDPLFEYWLSRLGG